jgi:hypothetical protein
MACDCFNKQTIISCQLKLFEPTQNNKVALTQREKE